MEKETNFTVECNCCHQRYENWVGSTPCCGSLANVVNKNGTVSKKSKVYSTLGVVEIEFQINDYQDINKIVDDNLFDLI